MFWDPSSFSPKDPPLSFCGYKIRSHIPTLGLQVLLLWGIFGMLLGQDPWLNQVEQLLSLAWSLKECGFAGVQSLSVRKILRGRVARSKEVGISSFQ